VTSWASGTGWRPAGAGKTLRRWGRRCCALETSDETAILLEELSRAAGAPLDTIAPRSPGVYAWFLEDPEALEGLPVQGPGVLYIGWSRDLAERLGKDLRGGRAAFSDLRRSLGALLCEELDLTARPSGRTARDLNYRRYCFDDEGEERLSEWMARNLRVAVLEHPDGGQAEGDLVALAHPPLNLAGWANPHGPLIRALREACADEARREFPR